MSDLNTENNTFTRETLLNLDSFDTPFKTRPDEPYFLRRINPNRTVDTQLITDMDRHPIAETFQGKHLPKKEFDLVIRGDEAAQDEPQTWMVYAVTNEQGDPIGWVGCYIDYNLSQLHQITEVPEDALVLSVTYQKLFAKGWEHKHFINQRDNLPVAENPGVAVSGVRQLLDVLVQKENFISHQMKQAPRKIYATAYTIPENIASETVLALNGFQKLDQQIEYEQEMNNAWIKELNPQT